jgi:hypothetical protein
MGSHTIEVTEIPDELIELLDERIRQTGGDRASFLRELMQRELKGTPGPCPKNGHPNSEMSFKEILGPIHQQVEEQGTTPEELDQAFEEALVSRRAARQRSRSQR